MVLLMQGFLIISWDILLFPADNVRTSAGKMTACIYYYVAIFILVACLFFLNQKHVMKTKSLNKKMTLTHARYHL